MHTKIPHISIAYLPMQYTTHYLSFWCHELFLHFIFQLTSFLPFFVNLQLPYNVIRGETAVVQANVFNYHPEDLQVSAFNKNSL